MKTTTAISTAFTSLEPFLAVWESPKCAIARTKLKSTNRDQLVNKFRSAFTGKKRLTALLLADELIERGIPPCFWHHHLSNNHYDLEQSYDLLVYDLRWLRARYRSHLRLVRYARYRKLFLPIEGSFHREAEFAFYQGKRSPGQIVRALSLTTEQQLDCWWLRSAPIVKKWKIVESKRSAVFTTLQIAINGVPRTATFSNDDAKATLFRRHRLWLCAQMAGGKPTGTAHRYGQLTGETLTRQIVANQLKNIEMTVESERLATRN